ncbi:hypothetical protein [Rhodococcus sp. NPDC058514]|uniref:hypothetical protein n=1 Tax=unclassified Rhodococcus (in: high G+C Gram-positive bacteria) TaxID=192944 RepID=UPI00365E2B15
MSINRIAVAARTPAVAALIGLSALGFAGAANAHPGEHPQPVEPPSAVAGQSCSEELRVGVDANTGGDLVCSTNPHTGEGIWGEKEIIGVHNHGDACDPSVDRITQTPDGHAMFCGGGRWAYH